MNFQGIFLIITIYHNLKYVDPPVFTILSVPKLGTNTKEINNIKNSLEGRFIGSEKEVWGIEGKRISKVKETRYLWIERKWFLKSKQTFKIKNITKVKLDRNTNTAAWY